MKALFFLLASTVFAFATNAQEPPLLRQGTVLKFAVKVGMQNLTMFIKLDTLREDKAAIAWSFENGRNGRFIVGKPSLDSAVMGYWSQPIPDEEVIIPATQNLLFISHLLYDSIKTNKKAVFDNYTITLQSSSATSAFPVAGKTVPALVMEGSTGAKLWVLDNRQTPLILKMENNPLGVNVELTGIDE